MEIKERKQWLVWRLQGDRKRCCNRWGEYCGSTDEHYYMTWDEAKAVSERLNVQGPAFCFTADDPYVGIDIDDSLIEYNQPKEWVLPLLERFKKTYLEVSPGLHGIKIYAKGKSQTATVPARCVKMEPSRSTSLAGSSRSPNWTSTRAHKR